MAIGVWLGLALAVGVAVWRVRRALALRMPEPSAFHALLAAIGEVRPEPGYSEGFAAAASVEHAGERRRVELVVPGRVAEATQLIVRCEPWSEPSVVLDVQQGRLTASHAVPEPDGSVRSVVSAQPAAAAREALALAGAVLRRLQERRAHWRRGIDTTAAQRVVDAFFGAWPQSRATARAALERQTGAAPLRRPYESDADDLTLHLWFAVMEAGHRTGLRLVDFVTVSDVSWTADRYREQPEPPWAAAFRAPREDEMTPEQLAAAIDADLAPRGWRLLMFDVMYGKPMRAEEAEALIAAADRVGLSQSLALGAEAFATRPDRP